jgi:hypothetical protein
MKLLGYSFGSFFKIGLIAMLFIVLAKWVLAKVKVPALSALAQAA